MKAAFIERHGGPEVLKYGDMPDPVAALGEVVVDIVAASVNGADWKVREGKSGHYYSITSSASASNVGGTVRPSERAVDRLMTRSNLFACTTGRSAGISPLRMRAA